MPAFVILCGIFFSPEDNIRKTFNQVLIPFGVYSVVYEVILFVASKDFSNYITNYSPVWIMWFMYSLVIWRLITPIFLKLPNPIFVSILL
ncbi:hypothetical protein ABUU23_20100, partial [Vibrio cholerae]